jgi:hypothetical protein
MMSGPVPVDLPLPVVQPPVVTRPPDLMIGLDLGSLTDPSAASLIQRSPLSTPTGQPLLTPSSRPLYRFDVLALRRFELQTPYKDIVFYIRDQIVRLPGVRLCIDATGVGRPIVETFRDLRLALGGRLIPYEPIAITITGGHSFNTPRPGEWNVAKSELVAATRVVLEMELIKFARGLPLADTLKRELLNFKIKISKAQNETYSARKDEHDDLVLAIAIPIFISYALDGNFAIITGPGPRIQPKRRHDPRRVSAANAARFFGGQRQIPPPGGIRVIKDDNDWNR